MEIKQNVRGTSQENDDYTGPSAQFTVDSDRNEVRLHDGTTPGGHRILNLSQLLEIFLTLDSELGAVQFSPEERGFLTRIDDKAWALRGMQAGNGIQLTNPLGTGGNTVISVSADYVGGIAAGLLARRMYHFVTQGTNNELLISLSGISPEWTFGDGVFFSVTFHATVADDASLKVGNLEPLPLRFANGSSTFGGTLKGGTKAILFLADGSWWVTGIQKANDVPISEIAGMPGIKDVQAALAHLRELVGGSGGGTSLHGIYGACRYGPLEAPLPTAITQDTHPIGVGESRVYLRTRSEPGDVNNNGWTERTLWYLTRLNDGYYQGRLSTLNTAFTTIGGNVIPDAEYAPNEVIRMPARCQFLGTGFSFPRMQFGNNFQISGIGVPVEL